MTSLAIRSMLLVMCIAGTASAQLPPASLPATAPTTAPRREANLPQGFQRVRFEGRTFFLEPGDEPWVRAALESAEPTTMPTTMPADLIEQLRTQREAIKQNMAKDLGLSDTGPIDEYFDQRLNLFLTQMDEYRPPIIYLVTTAPRLREIMKGGWTDPRFYYNRVADDVSYSTRVNLRLDERDDTVVPFLFDPDTTPEARGPRLIQQIHGTERGILEAVSRETLSIVTVAFAELVAAKGLEGLDLKPDQQWLGVGITGVLAAKYVAQLTGMDANQILDVMTMEIPGNPIRPSTIDLLHPTNLAALRPQAQSAYLDAYRRRSMQVVRALLDKAGEGASARVVAAIRKNPPADAAALLKLVQEQTGVDLSGQLGPR